MASFQVPGLAAELGNAIEQLALAVEAGAHSAWGHWVRRICHTAALMRTDLYEVMEDGKREIVVPLEPADPFNCALADLSQLCGDLNDRFSDLGAQAVAQRLRGMRALLAPAGASQDDQSKTNDPNSPYYPASHFNAKYGIPGARLRQARSRGAIAAVKVRSQWHYSEPGALQLWRQDMD